jgi:hypothetical protein
MNGATNTNIDLFPFSSGVVVVKITSKLFPLRAVNASILGYTCSMWLQYKPATCHVGAASSYKINFLPECLTSTPYFKLQQLPSYPDLLITMSLLDNEYRKLRELVQQRTKFGPEGRTKPRSEPIRKSAQTHVTSELLKV